MMEGPPCTRPQSNGHVDVARALMEGGADIDKAGEDMDAPPCT
jgi:hypothetical protein